MTSPDPAAILAQINAAREQTYQNIALAQGILDQANQAATAAAQDRAAIQAIAQQTVSVDTSVGTRVFAGDTMIHGDTGWCDIAGDLENGWTATLFRIKRVGDEVTIRTENLNAGTATSDIFYILLIGFRTGSSSRWVSSTLQMFASMIDDKATVAVVGGSGGSSVRAQRAEVHRGATGELKFSTANSWPTSLPDTPA